jgi:hypothetical protein
MVHRTNIRRPVIYMLSLSVYLPLNVLDFNLYDFMVLTMRYRINKLERISSCSERLLQWILGM